MHVRTYTTPRTATIPRQGVFTGEQNFTCTYARTQQHTQPPSHARANLQVSQFHMHVRTYTPRTQPHPCVSAHLQVSKTSHAHTHIRTYTTTHTATIPRQGVFTGEQNSTCTYARTQHRAQPPSHARAYLQVSKISHAHTHVHNNTHSHHPTPGRIYR